MVRIKKYIIPGAFLAFIFVMFGLYFLEAKPLDAKKYFDSEIHWKDQYIEIYGGVQKVLDKKTIEDYTIVKNYYGKMTKPYAELNMNTINLNVKKIIPICEYCKDKDIPYLYLTSLLPTAADDLPYLSLDYSQKNADRLMDELIAHRINLFDLRQLDVGDKERRFYRTDHHWTTDTTFAVYKALIENFQIDESLGYTELTAQQSFLGSYGIKVGKYYAGKDDFKVLIPENPGKYIFKSYDLNGNLVTEMEGTWFDTMIDQGILENDDYNNKYNSWLYAQSTEIRLINKEIGNDAKLLLISHSYGRPLAAYLSLCFHEVRQLDPQKGRFSGNYLDYIDEYQPDVVLFLVEFEGDLIGEYNTER